MENEQKQDECEVWFRQRAPGESMDAYMQSWLQQVDRNRSARENIGQPGKDERIDWVQNVRRAAELAPGMMVSDARANQTWRRIFDIKVVSESDQSALCSQDFYVDVGAVIVSLKECADVLYYHRDAMVWALIPKIVSDRWTR